MKEEPQPILAACLDCRWGTSGYSMDRVLTEVAHHEFVYDHLVHLWD